jgi:putative protease
MLYLVDGKGFRHPVYHDRNGRNHMLLCKDLWLVPFLKELRQAGVRRFRMEAAYLPQGSFEQALDALVKAAANLDAAETTAAAFKPPRSGFTAGVWHGAGIGAALGGDHEAK